MVPVRECLIGGLKVYIYGISTLKEGIPVTVLFLLHGRYGAHTDFGNSVILTELLEKNFRPDVKQQLLICIFDQRNYGERQVKEQANRDWTQGNQTHALDMHSILAGTAKDVSMLIDYLPSFLFPTDEYDITEWGVMGMGLGGHSTWLCLQNDQRISWGCPIIGCPSYLELMEYRLQQSGLPNELPYIPESFRRFLESADPGSRFRATGEIPQSLKTKHILVLSGAADSVVPWSASASFISQLTAESNKLEVHVLPGIGHSYHPTLLETFCNWMLQFI